MLSVTPNAPWPFATAALVRDLDPPHGEWDNVPIVIIPLCPATLQVNQLEFPNGVVILNDHPIPINAAPIELERHEPPGDPRPVDIGANVIWPTGTVVLWE